MKAFIEHWNKEIQPYIHNPADRKLAEYWWRAALEWTLIHEKFYGCCDYSSEDTCMSDHEDAIPAHIIDEELEQ